MGADAGGRAWELLLAGPLVPRESSFLILRAHFLACRPTAPPPLVSCQLPPTPGPRRRPAPNAGLVSCAPQPG